MFVQIESEPMLTDDQLALIAQDFYRVVLDRENQVRVGKGPIPDAMRRARIDHYEAVARNTQAALAHNDFLFATEVTHGTLRRLKLKDLTAQDVELAKQTVMRAGIDLAEALVARYQGNFNYVPKDELLRRELKAQQPPPSSPAEIKPIIALVEPQETTFNAAATAFIAQQRAAGRWDPQTAHQARKSYQLFAEIAGDRPLSRYGRKDAAHFKDIIERLPADYGKASSLRGLSPDQILEADAGREPRSERLSPRTVKRHLTALSTLWTDAISRGATEKNLFSGFKFPQQVLAQEQRDMWESGDLAQLFATPVWTGCQSLHRRSAPGPLILRDEKFWLPLVAVFSGLRQEEICQLHVSDIKCEKGIWYFDINDEFPRKLKNRTALRLVPIHSELGRIGCLNHVEEQKKRGALRVFPDLKPGGADGRLGHGFTKWFSRYRQETGIYRQGLDFHSFRHSATTFMHRAGVMDSLIDRVTGHATPGETARYTKGSDLKQLQRAIEAIAPCIDLSQLARV